MGSAIGRRAVNGDRVLWRCVWRFASGAGGRGDGGAGPTGADPAGGIGGAEEGGCGAAALDGIAGGVGDVLEFSEGVVTLALDPVEACRAEVGGDVGARGPSEDIDEAATGLAGHSPGILVFGEVELEEVLIRRGEVGKLGDGRGVEERRVGGAIRCGLAGDVGVGLHGSSAEG
jgi:hypothetical protein